MAVCIHIDRVSKSFKGQTVLDGISLDIDAGSITGLVGRNGSGKTVLLKILCGLLKPTSGTVEVNGCALGKDADFPPEVGVIIENPGFLPFESGYANLTYLAGLRKKIGKPEIEQAMQTVGLDPHDKKRVGKYSLGMKQRLGLAQAIMEDPSLLILDEPMNGLDKEGVADMRALLLQFRAQGKTILLVSHNREDIDTLCDRVYELDKGILTPVD